MACPIHDEILDALTDRDSWEKKQEIFYTMRHDGLRRKNKPYSGAADLHFPLIDTSIEKLKPFYYNQVFQGHNLASFVSKAKDAGGPSAMEAGEWFDYTLTEETDFIEELPSMIDYMLQRFRGILKARYCPIERKLKIEAVDPLYFVVPSSANGIDDADWFVHVKHLTVAQYKRERRYNQDPTLVKKIQGGTDMAGDTLDDEKKRREGLTYTRDKNQIILWEAYYKTATGYTVYEYAPEHPREQIRAAYALTTKWQDKVLAPFVDFPFEVKDKGWYSPRGVAERLAPFEAALCKTWNAKNDHLDYSSKPLFTGLRDGTNLGKSRIQPGEVLPDGLQKVDMGNPPASLDQEMINTRLTAEQLITMPDVGIGSPLNTDDSKTATEVNTLRALMGQGIEMRGGIFRNRMAHFYTLCWALLVAYTKKDGPLAYMVGDEPKELKPDALHQAYLIRPSGSPDMWNRERRIQQARQRRTAYANHPNVNQEELVKMELEAEDASLVKRLFIPSGLTEAREAEDEAMEITSLLMHGYPAQAMPNENHLLRLKIIIGKLQQLGATGQPVDPIAQQRIFEHIQMHLQFLREQDASAAKEVERVLEQMMQPQQSQQPQSQQPQSQSQETAAG